MRLDPHSQPRRLGLLFLILTGDWLWPSVSEAAAFDFTPITRQTERHYPSINNQGTVGYAHYTDQFSLGIYIKDRAGIATAIDDDVFWASPAGRAVNINNHNEVIFWGKTDVNSQLRNGLYKGSASGMTLLTNEAMIQAATGSTAGGTINPSVFLSDQGIAFFDYSGNTTTNQFRGRGYYTTDGNQIATISSQSLIVPDFDHPFQRLAMSPQGSLAYEYLLNSSQVELRVVHQGVERTVLTVPAERRQSGELRAIDINDQGLVAISAMLLAGGAATTDAGLYLDNGTSLTKLISTSPTGTYQGIWEVSLNNLGQIAFIATRDLENGQTGQGIYIGPNGAADKVIAVGDTLDGGIVETLLMGTSALNDQGQIVFWAAFEDGSDGVFLANPVVVPEPSLLAVGGMVLIGIAWRQRRRLAEARRTLV
jgi:hypothetical protein